MEHQNNIFLSEVFTKSWGSIQNSLWKAGGEREDVELPEIIHSLYSSTQY